VAVYTKRYSSWYALLASLLLHLLAAAGLLAMRTQKPQPQPHSLSIHISTTRSAAGKAGRAGSIGIASPLPAPPLTVGPDYWQEELAREQEAPLTSKRLLFGSYFKRIESAILLKWKGIVDGVLAGLGARWIKYKQGYTFTSRVWLEVGADGTILRARSVLTSGVPELDSACLEAFAPGTFIPNPPKDLGGALLWSCVVQL